MTVELLKNCRRYKCIRASLVIQTLTIVLLENASNQNTFVLEGLSNSLVVRKKEKSQNGGHKKTKQSFPENKHFLHPDTHTYERVRIRG